jgi:hypothetical protein
MAFLTARWKLIFLVGAVAGLAIFVSEPDYNTLQMSSDAQDFNRVLGDNDTRALIANVCDMIFALSYGVLGVVAFNKLASGMVALIGSLIAVGGAVADEIENVLVFLNITSTSLTDGRVDAMTTVGAIKWVLIVVALLSLAVLVVRARSRRT